MKALLMLEDGWCCECTSFTGDGEAFGELVFNTGLTGYQEVITDPSYRGQIVMMTCSMIGNYGIRADEDESLHIHTQGFVVKEYAGAPLDAKEAAGLAPAAGPPRHRPGRDDRDSATLHSPVVTSLASYLSSQQVPGVEGVDTRALTRHVREKGAMRAGISTRTLDPEAFRAKVQASPGLEGRDLVREVTCAEPYLYHDGDGARVAVLDLGIKITSLRELAVRGCRVEVFPAGVQPRDILDTKPDGILLSNGPGDPSALPGVVELVQSLLGAVPVFGICMGHQMIGRALGAQTFKLKFGHHGANHPARDERTRKVYITTQNHGFAVDPATLPDDTAEVSFLNLNDQTNEGLRHRTLPLFSVQFHPEAAPGPHDTLSLFDDFLALCRPDGGEG
jgi:carbamoyl-phosphate synthase small subunit